MMDRDCGFWGEHRDWGKWSEHPQITPIT